MDFLQRIRCFDRIVVSIISVSRNRAKIGLNINNDTHSFVLEYKYDHDVDLNSNLAGLMGATAVINYALFTGEMVFNFPTSPADRKMIREMVEINNVEVFVNRLCRIRYNFFKKEYLPTDQEITESNARGDTRLTFREDFQDHYEKAAGGRAAVMLSGGKESLLTFGIMKEIDQKTIPYFFNESGGHWKAAKHSHDVLSREGESARVWSNIDRFYNFMNHLMPVLDPVVSFSWADDYPVQLFLFPVYIFAVLPSASSLSIGHILMGNELDDPAEEPPYRGIKHYYGVYDQSSDFQGRFSEYLMEKGFGITLWSALYNIYGSVVEDILVKRYPSLYKLQRSCHSCRYVEGDVYPCGKCSKCLGVRLFIAYAKGNPEEIHYPGSEKLAEETRKERMKLDPDELQFLLDGLESGQYHEGTQVTGIHILPNEKEPMEKIPASYRNSIMKIISYYTTGVWKLENGHWIMVKK